VKTKTEPEPKAKHPVSILLPLTFPVIAASIERSQVRLLTNFYFWTLKRFVFSVTEKIFARKISKQFKQNVNFFFARGARCQSNTVTHNSVVIKQLGAATKMMTAGSAAAQKKLHVP
jgi:hypothetical protein